MRQFLRRLAPLALAGLVLVSLAPVTHAANLSLSEAERYEVELLNRYRAALGLVGVKIDSRLTAIARARSQDMADKNYFAHQQPDGKWAWDLMTEAGITWYGAGEILAWNAYDSLAESAENAAWQWRNSSSHYAVIKDVNMNYVGVGVVSDGSKKIWTAIFMKGPDRTGAWARSGTTTYGDSGWKLWNGLRVKTRNVTLRWSGADVKLSVLTSGFYYYRVEKRLNGGAWQPFVSATTARYKSVTLTQGILYEFRVRGRDRKGNWGSWSAPFAVRP